LSGILVLQSALRRTNAEFAAVQKCVALELLTENKRSVICYDSKVSETKTAARPRGEAAAATLANSTDTHDSRLD